MGGVQPNWSGKTRWATNGCSKVELRTAELLDARSAFDLLRNTVSDKGGAFYTRGLVPR